MTTKILIDTRKNINVQFESKEDKKIELNINLTTTMLNIRLFC